MSVPTFMPTPVSTPGLAPEETRMDTVELLVRDLDSMTDFYRTAVTLDVLDQVGSTSTLGLGGEPIINLRQEKELPDFDKFGAGLYHTAFLFQDQQRLATALASMAQHASDKYQGAADHLVSEAFYFADPEGNGIEIYRDRPREEWEIASDGSVKMATNFLHPGEFLQRWYRPENLQGVNRNSGEATGTIGHVHLQVGDIALARRFYEGVLGFDVTTAMPGALFVSAGGYHHHIGMNTWHSGGAGPRAATLGLGDVRIKMPTRNDIEALSDRLSFHGISRSDDGRTLRFEDPWGTVLAVSPEGE